MQGEGWGEGRICAFLNPILPPRKLSPTLPLKGRVGEFAQPTLELEPLIQAAQPFLVRRRRNQFTIGLRQHHIAFHRDQPARLRQPVERLAQIFADHAADLLSVLHHVVQRAILGEPLHRSFRADLVHARNVIHHIAGQCQIIHDALRRHAELGVHARHIQRLVAHGVDQRDMRVDQLRQVLVAGRDDTVRAILRGLLHQRANHIVRLHAIQHQQVPAGSGDGLVQGFNLLHKIFRHGGPMRLVFGIPVVAEGFTFCVEYAQVIIRRVIIAQLA